MVVSLERDEVGQLICSQGGVSRSSSCETPSGTAMSPTRVNETPRLPGCFEGRTGREKELSIFGRRDLSQSQQPLKSEDDCPMSERRARAQR